jgi:hypothetical protein
MLKATMIRHIESLMQRRLRQRRARSILNDLAAAGYSAEDLARLAHLRAAVDPALVVPSEPGAPDPTRPTLDDVLLAWRWPTGSPARAAERQAARAEDAEFHLMSG